MSVVQFRPKGRWQYEKLNREQRDAVLRKIAADQAEAVRQRYREEQAARLNHSIRQDRGLIVLVLIGIAIGVMFGLALIWGKL
jgi:hypothetical protein